MPRWIQGYMYVWLSEALSYQLSWLYKKLKLYHCFPYYFKMNLQVQIEPLNSNRSKSVATETGRKTTGV